MNPTFEVWLYRIRRRSNFMRMIARHDMHIGVTDIADKVRESDLRGKLHIASTADSKLR